MNTNKGTVIQIMGPVLDIRFPDDQLPLLLNAIEIPAGERTIVAEVAQHIGDNVARCSMCKYDFQKASQGNNDEAAAEAKRILDQKQAENACFHGDTPLEDMGSIVVQVFRDDELGAVLGL